MKSSQNNSEQDLANKASPSFTPTLTNNIFYNPLFLNLINLKKMGSIFTKNTYKTPWWRPLITAVGLLLMVGVSSNLSAQCDIIVNNPEGTVTAPDGSTVEFITVDLDLDNDVTNGGEAFLTRDVIIGRITSSNFNAGTNPCNRYSFYSANGTLIDSDYDGDGNIDADEDNGILAVSFLTFTCDHKDGETNARAGEFFFVRLDDDNDATETVTGETDNPISSYAAIMINSIEDNHGPTFDVAPATVMIHCDENDEPYNSQSPLNFDSADPRATVLNNFADNCSDLSGYDEDDVTYFDMAPDVFNPGTVMADGNVDPTDPASRTFTRVWTATDDCGNTGTATQRITVEDYQIPIFVNTTTVSLVEVDGAGNPDPNSDEGEDVITPAYPPNTAPIADEPPLFYTYQTFTGLSCGDVLPTFVPDAIDYCQDINDYDDDPNSANFNPLMLARTPTITTSSTVGTIAITSTGAPTGATATTNPNRYNYDVTRTWTATDDFGYTRTANRVFEYRDHEAPEILSVHNSLAAPTLASNQIIRDEDDNADVLLTTTVDTNEEAYQDTYTTNSSISASPSNSDCEASVTFNLDVNDNCAPNSVLDYSYVAYDILSNGTQTFYSSGGPFTNDPDEFEITIPFDSGEDYNVVFTVEDVVGNISTVSVRVEVRPVTPIIACGSILTVTLDPDGESFINAAQILGNIPNQYPNCSHFDDELTFEIKDTEDGNSFTDMSTGVGADNYSGANDASVEFDCNDVGDRQIMVRVTNNNGGEITCTRTVRVLENNNSSNLSASATASPASSSTASDGSITVSVANGGGSYTFSYSNGSNVTGSVSGSSPTTINNLPTGTYSVTVSSGNGCTGTTTVNNIMIGVNAPVTIEVNQGNCPAAFINSTVNIPITVEDFDNMTSIEGTVDLTGLTLPTTNFATSNLPATFDFQRISATRFTFSWFLQNMTSNPNGIDRTDGATIFTINAITPNSTGTYSVSLGNTPLALGATQNQGSGANASVDISVNPVNCSNGTIGTGSGGKIVGEINFCSPSGPLVNDVTLTTSPGGSTTDADGAYDVNVNVNSGGSVTITPSRPGFNIKWGVSGGDLVQIRRYLLGLSNSLTGDPYRIIAADAQGDGDVDGNDLTNIQRVLLGKDPGFGTATNNYSTPSWKFVNANQIFSNNDPFENNDPAVEFSRTFSNVNNTQTADFVGVKTGDATCSAGTPFQLASDENNELAENKVSNRSALPLNVKEQKLKAGETYEVTFTAQDFYDMLAYQTTIEFDTNILTFVGLNTNDAVRDLSANSFGLTQVEAGIITTLWYTANELDLDNGTELFTLSFEAQQDTPLSHVLNFTSSHLPQMAMGGDFEAFDINLTFDNAITNQSGEDKFNLNPNYPNPFDIETTISFDLTETEDITLNIMDISGKVIKSYQGTFAQGYNEINVNRAELPSSGILFYQLTTAAGQSAVQKMVVLD